MQRGTVSKWMLGMIFLAGSALGVGLAIVAGIAQKNDPRPDAVRIVYVDWIEGVAMTHLVEAVLENEYNVDVVLELTDVRGAFSSVAYGTSDIFLDAWLPETHEYYMVEYGNLVANLGPNFEGARTGLVVPAKLPVSAIYELEGNESRFDGRIIGIEPGAGIMRATRRAIREYGLDFELVQGSDREMTQQLETSVAAGNPVVVTGWKPHWMWGSFDLKFLEDPRNVYGRSEKIVTLTRMRFANDFPEIARFLKRFQLNEEQMGSLLGKVQTADTVAEAVQDWIRENPDVVQNWVRPDEVTSWN